MNDLFSEQVTKETFAEMIAGSDGLKAFLRPADTETPQTTAAERKLNAEDLMKLLRKVAAEQGLEMEALIEVILDGYAERQGQT